MLVCQKCHKDFTNLVTIDGVAQIRRRLRCFNCVPLRTRILSKPQKLSARWSDEELRGIAEKCNSFQSVNVELIRRYGRGHHPNRLRVEFSRIGADISHWTRCGKTPHNKVPLASLLTTDSVARRDVIKGRLLHDGVLQKKCSHCGLSDWLGVGLSLVLDHINGVPNDHRLQNLRLLCPNCDTQTDTWGRKNRDRKETPTKQVPKRVLPQRLPQEVFVKHQDGAAKNIRSYVRRNASLPYQCSVCQIGPEWLGRELVLQLDHINGDDLDNRVANLRFLCPNCHSQTPTFTGRNRRRDSGKASQ